MNDDKLSLREQFARIHGLFRRQRMQNCHAHGPLADPYQGQGRILRLLQMRPEISQKDLSYLLGMRPQSLGELLAKLERGGCVTREPLENDRRAMNIRLTEKGAAAASQNEPSRDPDEVFACLSAEEREILGGYLDRIIADLESKASNERENIKCGCHGEHGHGEHGHAEQCYGHEHEDREQCHGHEHEHREQCHGHEHEHREQCHGHGHEHREQCHGHGHEHGGRRHGHERGGCSHRHRHG